MSGYFTESNYENAVLQLLNEELGYTYVYGPDVARDYHSPLYEDVLLLRVRQNNDRTIGFRRQWKEVYAARSK